MKEVFKEIVDSMITQEIKKPTVHSKTADQILRSVEPRFSPLATYAYMEVLIWSEEEVMGLFHYFSGDVLEWRAVAMSTAKSVR